jgi:hypothetical protein
LQQIIECDQELYKRIGEYTKETLFRHIKFITSDAMLNDLESPTSLANITMNHFGVDVRDRILWWRSCGDAVRDAIGNQWNQVTQAIKAQVLSKSIMKGIFMDGNSPFSSNNHINVLELKAKAKEMQLTGNEVPPTHQVARASRNPEDETATSNTQHLEGGGCPPPREQHVHFHLCRGTSCGGHTWEKSVGQVQVS